MYTPFDAELPNVTCHHIL